MPFELTLKGQGTFIFPDTMTLEESEKVLRRDFPDMIENAQPLPSFAEKEMAQLREHEGETLNTKGKHVSYLDSLNNLTGGIGHLMSDDEKRTYPVGTAIPDSVVVNWFKADTKRAEKQANSIFKSFALEDSSDEVKQIIFNMVFNLGEGNTKKKTGLRGFTEMLGALSRKDHAEAAKEMKDSVWFGQVKSRGVSLVSRMNALAKPLDNPPGAKFIVPVGPLKEGDSVEPTPSTKGRN